MSNYFSSNASFPQLTYTIDSNSKNSLGYTCPDNFRKEKKMGSYAESFSNSPSNLCKEETCDNEDLDKKISQLRQENEELIKEMNQMKYNNEIQVDNEPLFNSYQFNEKGSELDNSTSMKESKEEIKRKLYQDEEYKPKMMKTGPIGKIKSKKEEISPKEKMLHTSFDFFNYLSEQLNEPSFSYEDMLNNPDELKYKLLNLQEKIQNVIESKNTNAIKEYSIPLQINQNKYYPSFGNQNEELNKSYDYSTREGKYKNCQACLLNINNSSKGYIPYKMFAKPKVKVKRSLTPDVHSIHSLQQRRYLTKLFKQKV